jgi:hypothetical protein
MCITTEIRYSKEMVPNARDVKVMIEEEIVKLREIYPGGAPPNEVSPMIRHVHDPLVRPGVM